MKKYFIKFIILLLLVFFGAKLNAQTQKRYKYRAVIIGGDTIQHIIYPDVRVLGKYLGKGNVTRKNRRKAKRYNRLVNAVLVTYPVALEAGRTLKNMEVVLATMTDEKEQEVYAKSVEDSLKIAYTPFLKRISMYQGMVLLKLIDRETGKTSFKLVQELRGRFSAFFWQNITRLFGGDLKVEYDKEGTDAEIEEIIMLYYYGVI